MDIPAIRRQAEDLYRSGKFLCSEAIVYTFNEALGYPFLRRSFGSLPVSLLG
jgi:hypothetical protein